MQDSKLGMNKTFLFPTTASLALGSPSLLFNGFRRLFGLLKANHSPPSSAKANTGGFILPLYLGHVSIACTGTAVYVP
jgi:hypothetical protein